MPADPARPQRQGQRDGDGEAHVDDEADEHQPRPGPQPFHERLGVGDGQAGLDPGQGGEDGGDHERIEDGLEEERHPQRLKAGVGRGAEELEVVQGDVAGQPHRQHQTG